MSEREHEDRTTDARGSAERDETPERDAAPAARSAPGNLPWDPDADEDTGSEPEFGPVGDGLSDDGVVRGGTEELRAAIQAALRTCYDPEIPVDIYQLGLIYAVRVADTGEVEVDMTLTSPNCPVAGTLPGEVEQTVESVRGVKRARATVVWDPPWGPDKMSEAARLQLGLF